MPTPQWVTGVDQRVSDVLQLGPAGPRSGDFAVAIEHLRWALWCIESLHELEELITLDEPSGDGGPSALGHRSYPIAMGHLSWAAATALGGVDRLAAALGVLALGPRANGRVHDLRTLKRESRHITSHDVRNWVSKVSRSPIYKDLVGIRNPMVHSTTLIRVTTSRSLGAHASRVAPGAFAFRSTSNQAVTASQIIDTVLPFLENLLLDTLTLIESWKSAPTAGRV